MIVVDANLLIYVVNGDDPRHDRARRWWESLLSGNDAVGIPWVVALAFVRITTRRGLLPAPLAVKGRRPGSSAVVRPAGQRHHHLAALDARRVAHEVHLRGL